VLFPYKKKNHFVTGWDKQSIKIDTERGIIKLSRPEIHNNEGQKKRQKPVTCYVKTLPKDIVQVELIYRDKYYLCIKYIEEIEYLQINSENHAAIDLGEIHSITSIDSSSNAIIITGRLMRSIKRLRNKEQAKIRSRMTKCEKGSRQYKRYSKALRNIKAKTDRQIHDCIHKISKLYLDFCIHNNISIVYFGDLDGASRSTKQKRRGNKMVRQKLSQWNFGQMMKLLENKLIRYNIRVIKISEAYSSQKCPQCDKLNKPKGREYKCRRCNYQQHRDINGAINILNDNASTKILRYKKLKYLQIT
jgi:putative transposase